MSDWDLPILTSAYSDVLTYIKDRDFDAISLGFDTITNPQEGMLRYVRASNKFQEYDGSSWTDKTLALAGGGTGAATASDARTNLGLGSIATQNANGVTITGGTISGLGSLGVSGNVTIGGQLIVGTTPITLTDASGKIPALSSNYFASLSGANLTALVAANITAGGTLPALNGSALTNLNGANIASGQIPVARLGTGTANSSKVLLGDGTWGDYNMFLASMNEDVAFGATENTHDIDISGLGVTAAKEIMVIRLGPDFVVASNSALWNVSVVKPTSTTTITIQRTPATQGGPAAGANPGVTSTHSFFIARIRVP